MKKIIIFAVLLLIFNNLIGQKLAFNGCAGYGVYQLNELKQFQLDLKNSMHPLPVESIEKFPGFLNYSLGIEYSKNGNYFFGITTSFYTTGARNHLKDYSGEYKLDMILDGYRIGLQYRAIQKRWNKVDLSLELKSGVIFSTLKVTELINILNSSDNSGVYKFRSRTVFMEPSVRLNYPINSKISFETTLGYELNLKSSIYSKENPDYDLKNMNGNSVHLNWSGVRFALGIGYNLDL